MPANNSMIKIAILSVISVALIAVVGISYLKPLLVKNQLPKPVAINTDNQPTLGADNAKVHIVAFEDLKCSNCARFDRELMPYIKKHFIDTGIAKYTMINVAFINGSMPAANAARCVYDQKPTLFFDYVDYIYKNQPPENENWATIPTLMNFASQIKGINTDQLAQCLLKSPYDALIQNNLTIASKIMGNNVSTPTLYINGILVRPLSESQIKNIIAAVK